MLTFDLFKYVIFILNQFILYTFFCYLFEYKIISTQHRYAFNNHIILRMNDAIYRRDAYLTI